MPGFELIGKEEQDALNKIFTESGGVLFAHGFPAQRNGIYHVREFEKEFANHFKVKHATAVSSGTAALKVALKAVGVQPGDEVITQDFTFIASVEAILDLGAKPVIAAADASLNMDVEDFRRKITPKTKAVMPVHMLGFPANIEAICTIAKEKGIAVIEDNCEATGASFKDTMLGCWGDVGVFSFDFGKIITTGEGGMVVTNNDKIAKYMREYHDHGHENNPSLPRGRDSRTIYGFNFRMTEMQGTVGRVQLKKLTTLLSANAERYAALNDRLKNVVQMRHMHTHSHPIFDTFMFSVSNPIKHQEVLSFLQKSGIGTKNVPDAIEWHFAGHWDHIFSKEEISKMAPTAKMLNSYISIPIMVKRSVQAYKEAAEEIAKILS